MKISYQRMYNVGLYLNERIGFEIEAPDECDPIAELQTLKELSDKAHKELNPDLEEMQGTTIRPAEETIDKEKEAEIDKAFQETKERIIASTTKAAAGQILLDSGFKLNMELKTLVNLKPE